MGRDSGYNQVKNWDTSYPEDGQGHGNKAVATPTEHPSVQWAAYRPCVLTVGMPGRQVRRLRASFCDPSVALQYAGALSRGAAGWRNDEQDVLIHRGGGGGGGLVDPPPSLRPIHPSTHPPTHPKQKKLPPC